MDKSIKFLTEVGKLKGKARRGWTIHGFKNPETTAEHIFSLAVLVWTLGKGKRLNMERAIKLALIHDICEVYAPDLTSYDAIALGEGKKIKDVLKMKKLSIGRPTNGERKKLEKIKQVLEERAMKKLFSQMPEELKKEVKNLWIDYERGLTREARFVKQADKIENLLQGMKYWKKYGKIPHHLWLRRIKEVVDDPDLVEFIYEIERKFYR